MKNIKTIYLLIFLFFLSCGFKPANLKDRNQIFLQEINISGEKKIGYTLKNNILLISNKTSKDKYTAKIKIVKQKNIKIKDTTGKVTRFNLSLSANLQLTNLKNNIQTQKYFIRTVNFDVADVHFNTINNERNATDNLTQQISDDIIYFISFSGMN